MNTPGDWAQTQLHVLETLSWLSKASAWCEEGITASFCLMNVWIHFSLNLDQYICLSGLSGWLCFGSFWWAEEMCELWKRKFHMWVTLFFYLILLYLDYYNTNARREIADLSVIAVNNCAQSQKSFCMNEINRFNRNKNDSCFGVEWWWIMHLMSGEVFMGKIKRSWFKPTYFSQFFYENIMERDVC